MTRALLLTLAAVCVGVAAGCTGADPGSTLAEGEAMRPVAIYLVRDGTTVAPVRRSVDVASDDPVHATLLQLYKTQPTGDEAAAGYTNALDCPNTSGADEDCVGLDVVDGDARVTLAKPLSRLAQAQTVYTLTRFPEVRNVVFVARGTTSEPLTRADFEDETPPILVDTPLPGDRVRSPVRLRGTANVFEATVSIDVRDASDKLLKRTFTTATSGSGTRGRFSAEIALPDRDGPVTVVAYESSAKDGTPLHVVKVPLTLAR